MKRKISLEKIIYPNTISELAYLESYRNYTFLYFMDGKKIVTSYNLGILEQTVFPNSNIQRIHYSYMVNMNYVKNIFEKEGYIKLFNHEILPIGKHYKEKLEQPHFSLN